MLVQRTEDAKKRHSAKMLAKWGVRHQPRPKVFFSPPKSWEEIKKVKVASSGVNRFSRKESDLRQQIRKLLGI